MKAALYTRVSTSEQAEEGFSLAVQIDKLRAYAKVRGVDIGGEYVDDGTSGRTTRRTAYQRMMAEKDQWDAIYVLKMDRIHRNSRNFMAMMDDLKRDGKDFVSVMESFDSATAMGRFVMDIVQRIAQLESEQTGERVLVAMAQKARQGSGGLGGSAPYGYRWKEGKLIAVTKEASRVRLIFRLSKKHGPKEIAAKLNDDGCRTRQGKPWTYWNVSRILENPVYLGHLRWSGIVQENTHQALVET